MKTPIHLVIGQEATSVGCCAALTHDDLLYCSHRTHGNYLAKGGDLRSMLCEMFCRVNGCAGSRGGSMHLIDKRVGMAGTSAIVGGALPIAVGAALAAKMKREPHAIVAVFGEAATEEGVTSESLNFAVLKQLPVIFLCENNFYSVQSPLWTRQPPRAIWKWAEGHGLPSVKVDGMNVLAVYEAARQAAKRAHSGGGPTFIEAVCYRFRAHGGAGDDTRTGYRDQAERDAWDGSIRLRCTSSIWRAQVFCPSRVATRCAGGLRQRSSTRSSSPWRAPILSRPTCTGISTPSNAWARNSCARRFSCSGDRAARRFAAVTRLPS